MFIFFQEKFIKKKLATKYQTSKQTSPFIDFRGVSGVNPCNLIGCDPCAHQKNLLRTTTMYRVDADLCPVVVVLVVWHGE
jgi:hypothetical protein